MSRMPISSPTLRAVARWSASSLRRPAGFIEGRIEHGFARGSRARPLSHDRACLPYPGSQISPRRNDGAKFQLRQVRALCRQRTQRKCQACQPDREADARRFSSAIRSSANIRSPLDLLLKPKVLASVPSMNRILNAGRKKGCLSSKRSSSAHVR